MYNFITSLECNLAGLVDIKGTYALELATPLLEIYTKDI